MIYLITGATGDVGTRVVLRLINSGNRPRVFVRDADKTRSLHGNRVEVIVGDLADGASLRAALEGVDAFFLVNSGPQIPVRDEVAATVAKDAGVKHLVKLSSMDVQQGLAIGAWHERGEAAIRRIGCPSPSSSPRDLCRTCLPGERRLRPKELFALRPARAGEHSSTPTISQPS